MKASEIAMFLKSVLIGDDIDIVGVCSLNNPKDNHVAFFKFDVGLGLPPKTLVLIKPGVLPVTPMPFIPVGNPRLAHAPFILVGNPRLAHAEVVNKFFAKPSKIVPFGGGVIMYDCVEWGEGCHFKPGAIIGTCGFSFEHGVDGIPIPRPHTGGVKIGNNVQIGCNSIVQRGTIDDTIIHNNVKIDDQVHFGHNCIAGENTIITAGTVVCGTVTIGKNCWIGANSTLIQHITIGDNVTIGIGANVVKDVPSGTTYVGFMARPLDELRRKKGVKNEVLYGL